MTTASLGRHLWQRIFTRAKRAGRSAACRKWCRPPLLVEALEERTLMTTSAPLATLSLVGNPYLVDAADARLDPAAVPAGLPIYINKDFQTSNLPAFGRDGGTTYIISNQVDTVTYWHPGGWPWGVGVPGTSSWSEYWGGWQTEPGPHTASGELDAFDNFAQNDASTRAFAFTFTTALRPVVTIQATAAMATEAGQHAGVFTVTRSGNSNFNMTVTYTVSGTAQPGTDYTALTGSVLIPAGQTSATITVTPLNDAQPEASESVIASLGSGATYTVGNAASATVALQDNQTIPTIGAITGVTDGGGRHFEFALRADHSASAYDATGWHSLGGTWSQVTASLDDRGRPEVFALGTDHASYVHDTQGWHNLGGQWLKLSGVEAGNKVYGIALDHTVWVHGPGYNGWTNLGGSAIDISATVNNLVYAITADHGLWFHDTKGWHSLGGGVIQISAAYNYQVYALDATGTAWEVTPFNTAVQKAGWRRLGDNILQISAGRYVHGQDELFALKSDYSLWVFRPVQPYSPIATTWSKLGGGSFIDLTGMANNSVFAVAADHAGWVHTSAGWKKAGGDIAPETGDDYVIATVDQGVSETVTQAILKFIMSIPEMKTWLKNRELEVNIHLDATLKLGEVSGNTHPATIGSNGLWKQGKPVDYVVMRIFVSNEERLEFIESVIWHEKTHVDQILNHTQMYYRYNDFGYVAWQETQAYLQQLVWLQLNVKNHDEAFKAFVKRLGDQVEKYVKQADANIALHKNQETFMEAASKNHDVFADYHKTIIEIRNLVKILRALP